jgi:putative ABC transport system ATP-binding protein
MEDAVRALDLRKTYGAGSAAVTALDHVSLTLARGTVAALLGPSGAGKSTLVKALGFVSPADTGEVFFEGRPVVKDGVPLADLTRIRRNHLGFVFQRANLTSFLTARENVELACELGGKDHGRSRARELLRYLEVANREDSYPEMLSGGEQQRVAIARALATGNPIMLADEPTGELDFSTGVQILELLQEQAGAGRAVLVVTHNREISRIADRVVELSSGRIVGDGAPRGGKALVGDLRW